MSVGIALISESGESIICVTDSKIDFGEFSADKIGQKEWMFEFDCVALVVGNDSEYATAVLASAERKLRGKLWTPEIAAECVSLSLTEELHKKIARTVLSKYGLTVETFRDKARKLLTPDIFASLCQKIERVKISLQFLVCGFEKHPSKDLYGPHIYHIDSSGVVTCHDSMGMWVIGSGNYLALSSLAFAAHKRKLSRRSSLGESIYCALEAKFMSESTGLVGQDTNLSVISPNKSRLLVDRDIEEVRKSWQQFGAPRIPAEITKSIPSSLVGFGWRKATTKQQRDDYLSEIGMRPAKYTRRRKRTISKSPASAKSESHT